MKQINVHDFSIIPTKRMMCLSIPSHISNVLLKIPRLPVKHCNWKRIYRRCQFQFQLARESTSNQPTLGIEYSLWFVHGKQTEPPTTLNRSVGWWIKIITCRRGRRVSAAAMQAAKAVAQHRSSGRWRWQILSVGVHNILCKMQTAHSVQINRRANVWWNDIIISFSFCAEIWC